MYTFPPGLSDGVSCTLAHYFGDVDRTVHTVSKSDGTKYCFSFQLYKKGKP